MLGQPVRPTGRRAEQRQGSLWPTSLSSTRDERAGRDDRWSRLTNVGAGKSLDDILPMSYVSLYAFSSTPVGLMVVTILDDCPISKGLARDEHAFKIKHESDPPA